MAKMNFNTPHTLLHTLEDMHWTMILVRSFTSMNSYNKRFERQVVAQIQNKLSELLHSRKATTSQFIELSVSNLPSSNHAQKFNLQQVIGTVIA